MINVKIIATGSLKEAYLRDAAAEYSKRLSAFCRLETVELKEYDSAALAGILGRAADEKGCICFIIGSSHGLDERVKAACDLRLSLSKLTFPHQLFRIMLLEAVYRSFNIINGTKYHK